MKKSDRSIHELFHNHYSGNDRHPYHGPQAQKLCAPFQIPKETCSAAAQRLTLV